MYLIKTIIKELVVVPPKIINQFLKIFHIRNGHKGYINFVNDILDTGFYMNGIYKKAKKFNSLYVICNQNRKNIFRKPSILQIVPQISKEVYQIDLTILPFNFKLTKMLNFYFAL